MEFSSQLCVMILSLILKFKLDLIGIFVGSIAGFLYYYFVGCTNGTCMIASNPLVAIPYFSFLGYLIAGLFKKAK